MGLQRLHDITISRKRDATVLLLWLGISLVVTLVIAFLLYQIHPWLSYLSPVSMGLMVFVWRRTWLANAREALTHAGRGAKSLRDQIETAFALPETYPLFAYAVIQRLRNANRDQFPNGTVYRIGSELTDVVPIDVPTEPIPLARRHAYFKTFAQERPSRRTTIGGAIGSGFVFLVLTFYVIFMVAGVWFTGSLEPILPILGLIVALEQFYPVWSPMRFAVPGGVLIRGWQLRLATRENARLVYQQLGGGYHIIVMWDDGPEKTFALPREEADVLLAAWLSDITPPTEEQVSEFA